MFHPQIFRACIPLQEIFMSSLKLDLRGSRILIVDDVPDNLDLLCRALEDAQYQVQVATSGAQALNIATRSLPDLILLDVLMPEMDGFETCRRLKAHATTQNIPVVFLTALDNVSQIVEGFDVGGADYITKPFQKEEILARIENHITLYRLKHNLEEQVKERSRALQKQLDLFRKFVPQSFTQDFGQTGFSVTEGLAREETYAVFCCDIRNFTTFSESISCTECYRFLNSFFMVMEPGIRKFGGFVYQYVGDEVMALFPLLEGKFADRAVQSAVEIQNRVIVEYNQGRTRAGYDPIRIGVGINTGAVAIGIAGTPERMDACAFGSTVNLAARCEGLTKEYDAKVIITQETYRCLKNPESFEMNNLGTIPIRGMEAGVELYEVLGMQ